VELTRIGLRNAPGPGGDRYLCEAVTVTIADAQLVFVSGAVGHAPPDDPDGPGDLTAQTRRALERIDATLQKAGGSIRDVVRLRFFVCGPWRAEMIDELFSARNEVLPLEGAPAATFAVAEALALPEMLVEVEAEAVIPAG
jgi:enamine deaminase RidA (YjgF/YER057c/UK114 family)